MQAAQIGQLAQAGIVGAGGAGFPTHVKLSGKADVVILNGAECEPLLRVDQQLMSLYPQRILEGLELAIELTGAREGVVALKNHYRGAVAALERELPRHRNIRICHLGSFYPAGDEQVVVYEATGRIVPEGGIPLQVGAVVLNVETALNLRNALLDGKPVTHKYVTVTGAVARPRTLFLPLGISVKEVLALAGGPTVGEYRVLNGGPMMGSLVTEDSPVTKTTKGIIVLPAAHPLLVSLTKPLTRSIREAGSVCMQCSQCSVTCPRGLLGHRLEPHKLMRIAAYGKTCDGEAGAVNAFLCCGCRLCEYACVMGLQPWKFNSALKMELSKNGVKNPLNRQPVQVDPFRAYKRYPTEKLIYQLGLNGYDVPAPLEGGPWTAKLVCLPLKQGVGVQSLPVVKQGDAVNEGDLLAVPEEGRLGSCLHASIAGVVSQITPQEIVLSAMSE